MIAAHRDPEMRRQLRAPITSAEQARRVIASRLADREAKPGSQCLLFFRRFPLISPTRVTCTSGSPANGACACHHE
jgi:hypothetical protein